MEERIRPQDQEDEARGSGQDRQGGAQEQGEGERGLRHRVEAKVERVDREPEADHDPPEDPGYVRQQASQEDPARVEPSPEPVTRGSLRGEVDEGVRHSSILLQGALPSFG